MKAGMILVFSLLFIALTYGMAYVSHTCTVAWHCGADLMMLILGMVLSIIGILYALIEVR